MQQPPARGQQGPRSGLTLQIGPAEIRLRADPLETILRTTKLEAIVSSDDSNLSMGGGVSGVIARLAGECIRDQVAANLPLPVGSVAVTSGGKLPIRYVIHAVTVDWARDFLPTRRTIRQLLRGILSRCEALRIRSIAIPALGTGAAGLSPEVSAKIIAKALHEHVVNPTVLRSVVLPIPRPLVHQVFARELAMPSPEEITDVSSPQEQHERGIFEARAAARLEGAAAPEPRAPPRHAPIPTSSPERPPGGRGIWSWFRGRRKPEPTSKETETRTVTLPAEEQAPADESSVLGEAASRPLLGRRYVLLEEIGRGGMAIVYLSWDLVLRRVVAIKVLRPDAADTQSLRREAAAALELTHENVVRLYHFEPGEDEGQPFLVMEYLSWPSGEKWIADAGAGGLPVRSVVDVGHVVCNALAHAHSRNILHLDIKPSNIFVDPGGENAKLGDFGLARIASPGGSVLQLRPAGTPAYMAPEQVTHGARVSSATDVYQLAATLWDFVTGRPPRPERLDVEQFEHGRRRILSVLHQGLAPDPSRRPSAGHLREMVASVS